MTPTAAADDLKPFAPVTDGLALAALDRAANHESSREVWVFVLAEHLGFEPTPKTVAALRPLLEDMRREGFLTRTESYGIEPQGRECWSLTAEGEQELARRREEGSGIELPESPQHRVWRQARIASSVRIEEFRREMIELWEETDELLCRWDPVLSERWFELAGRLHDAAWRLGSAVHCLTEGSEPGDEEPDIDEDPGPAPGRRSIAAWDGPHSEPGGQP